MNWHVLERIKEVFGAEGEVNIYIEDCNIYKCSSIDLATHTMWEVVAFIGKNYFSIETGTIEAGYRTLASHKQYEDN
jgi:hypothetical protein